MGKVPLYPIANRICEYCGNSFEINRKQRDKKFCNKSCATFFNQRPKIKNNFNCLNCDKEIRSPRKPDGRRKKYCSLECKAEHKGTLPTCGFCGKKFRAYGRDKEKVYCSRECRNKAIPVPMADLICAFCGLDFKREISQAFRSDKDPFRRVYCSPECFSKGISGKNNPLYLGNRNADRGPSWKKQRKKAVKEANGKCYFCDGLVKGKSANVDHIIPFRLFEGVSDEGKSANELINLWVLCRSCHAKKTQLEVNVLYSVGFESFMKRVSELTDRDVVVRMTEAHKHWTTILAESAEKLFDETPTKQKTVV